MNAPDLPPEDAWSYSILHRVDCACDQFEELWNAGQAPIIQEFLALHSELPRTLVLFEILRIEVHLRIRAGEAVSKAEYLSNLPQDADVIERVWREDFESSDPTQSFVDRGLGTTVKGIEGKLAEIPDQLGRFQILREIGKGGFGTVHLASCADLGEVALKIPNTDVLVSSAQRQRIIEEAQVGKSLDHPHLVRTFDVEEIDGYVVIIQQYIDGVDLAEWHREKAPYGTEIARVLIPIAEALGHLHEMGFVHRDLKPANILVDRSGNPHVTDFGLALHEDVQRHHKWELAGTWPYMSPEQIRRQSHLIDGQSDIWSLGVILYRLLTQRLPFGGPVPKRLSKEFANYLQELEFEIAEHDPKPPRMVRPAISRTLEKICLRCLEKRKRDRYPTALDMAEELQLYVGKLSSSGQSMPSTRIRVVPKGLHSFAASDADFFMDLLPGPRTNEGIPASLSFWRNRLSGGKGDPPVDIGVIYGPSGCGKSSFVRAGLLPQLDSKFVPVVVDATSKDTEVRLIKGLRQAHPELPESDSMVELCGRLTNPDSTGQRTLIVLDQFEQWLQANSENSASQLLTALQQCNGLHLQAILLVRDDFWMPLARFMERMEVSLQENQNTAAVDLFDKAHARHVLCEFGRAYGRLGDGELSKPEERFLTEAIEELQTGGRIICVRLSLFAEMMKNHPWTPDELHAVGGAKGIGQKFLEQNLGPHAPVVYRRHSAAAQKVLGYLLPPFGSDIKGQMRTSQDIFDASGYKEERDCDQLVDILNHDLKLITPVTADSPDGTPHENTDQADSYYQLTHDFLVPSIRDFLSSELRRTRAGRARLSLRERSEDWERHPTDRHLPSCLEWLSIRWHVPKQQWSAVQKKMMGRLDRSYLLRTCVVLAASILLIATGRVLVMENSASSLRNEALNADTTKLPQIAERIHEIPTWSQPKLAQQYEQEFGDFESLEDLDEGQFRRWMHLVLLLDDPESTERVALLVQELSRVPPEDLGTVVTMLAARDERLNIALRDRLSGAASFKGADLLALSALVARTKLAKEFFTEYRSQIAEELCNTRPTHFPFWLSYLEPMGVELRQPLIQLLEETPTDQGVARSQVIDSLARYAQDSLTLIAAIEIAEPEEFHVLIPPLRKVAKPEDWDVPEEPEFDSAAIPKLHQALEATQGKLTNRGGFALAVPQQKTKELIKLAADAGFRPISIRPYRNEEGLLNVVVWARDVRRFRFAAMVSQEELLDLNNDHESDSFHIVDFAIAEGPETKELFWWAVWEQTKADEPETRLDLPMPEVKATRDEHMASLKKDGFIFTKYVGHTVSEGSVIRAAIWQRLGLSVHEANGSDVYAVVPENLLQARKAVVFGDYRPGNSQTEIRRINPVDYLAIYLKKKSLYQSKFVFRQSGNEILDLLRSGDMSSFSPRVIEAEWNSAHGTFFSAIWSAPIIDRDCQVERSKKLSNRALAAAMCGQDKCLMTVLSDQNPDRDVCSYSIERLASTGFPVARAEQILLRADSPLLRRSVLLALGGYPRSQVPASVVNEVGKLANSPHAGVCFAARWCLNHWGIESQDSTGPVDATQWYTGISGQTMIRVAPIKFLMGSPVHEGGRQQDSEQQNWMRIPRNYDMGATHVTVEKFREFVNDPSVKERLPTDHFDDLKKRIELDQATWHVRCPQTGVSRLDAMLYCEWLSEKEGIAESQRCYPGIWEYAGHVAEGLELTFEEQKYGYRPVPDVLERTGYRLPTDAEIEFASRAGGTQARFFGESDELLDAYAWYDQNSKDRAWPVAMKKPNQFGFFDIMGNVTQHCQNLYLPYETPNDKGIRLDELIQTNETGSFNLRGGEFSSPAADMRCAKRFNTSHTNRRLEQGFRVCRTNNQL